jgi:hypothetical protein
MTDSDAPTPREALEPDPLTVGSPEVEWFQLARDFTYTGPHDIEAAHAIVAEHRPLIEAALRLADAASTAAAGEGHICANHDEALDEAYRKGVTDALRATSETPRETPLAGPLDVEVLAEAIWRAETGAYLQYADPVEARKFAVALAAVYARLPLAAARGSE